MFLPNISICGVVDFQKIARAPFTHVISIWHANPSLESFHKQMHVGFPNADIHFSTFDDTEGSEMAHAPATSDILACLKYVRTVPENSHLLIHCMAGVSRSSAIAMTIISDFYGSGSERDAALSVKQIRPTANPNRLILQLTDEVLERGGALTKAADEVFGPSLGLMNKGW